MSLWGDGRRVGRRRQDLQAEELASSNFHAHNCLHMEMSWGLPTPRGLPTSQGLRSVSLPTIPPCPHHPGSALVGLPPLSPNPLHAPVLALSLCHDWLMDLGSTPLSPQNSTLENVLGPHTGAIRDITHQVMSFYMI